LRIDSAGIYVGESLHFLRANFASAAVMQLAGGGHRRHLLFPTCQHSVKDLKQTEFCFLAVMLGTLIEPFSGDLLLSQVESQLHLVSERKPSEQILGGQKEILEMIACGATFESIIEALALLIEKIEPDIRSVIAGEMGIWNWDLSTNDVALGLAISKTIVDAHDGAIAVHSAGKDLGAAFSVRLPLTSEPGPAGNLC
jgi:hypothetical protein